MTKLCAWCLDPVRGKPVGVVQDTDATVELRRFFCDASHQSFYETNQFPKERLRTDPDDLKGLPVEEIARQLNLMGYAVNNCFQAQVMGSEPFWRVNCHVMAPTGAVLGDFTDYADSPTLEGAMIGAYAALRAREGRKGTMRPLTAGDKPASKAKMDEMWKLFHNVMEKWADGGT